MVEEPYGIASPALKFALQVKVPPRAPARSALARHLFDCAVGFEGGLLVHYDWALYRPDEMALVSAVRRSHGELRWLIDAPGHLFNASEKDDLIGQACLQLWFEWSAYVYLPQDDLILNFWEGELIDVWTSRSETFKAVENVVSSLELKKTFSRE